MVFSGGVPWNPPLCTNGSAGYLMQLSVKSLDFDNNKLHSEMESIKKENKQLVEKIDDLENRSRRNNLVFFGVPERDGRGEENCFETVIDLLQNFVGIEDVSKYIERCHRTPSYRNRSAELITKPRVIHVAFSSYVIKEKVRKASIEKFKSMKYKDSKIFVNVDLSARVLQLRKNLMGQFMKLKKEGKKPFFVFPASIKYRKEDGTLVSA